MKWVHWECFAADKEKSGPDTMAFTRTDNPANGTRQASGPGHRPLGLGIALGWLCLAAVRAGADSPALPGFAPAAPSAALAGPLSIPLNVQFGRGGGVSFLYNLAAAPAQGGGNAPAAPRAATYGFSNALAFGGDSLHLNGLMYMGSGPGADGKAKTSQVISQALSFQNKGWKLDAHYQSVGKDFGAADMLKGAAPTLGLASDLTAATAAQMQGLRGQNDLGFGLAHADAHGSLSLGFKENENAVTHVKTTQQSLSLGRTFGHGLQFEAGQDTLRAAPTQGGASSALTTTTNHLKLGMDGGQGLSFSAEANLIGDTKGRAEQHLAYSLADQLNGTHFAARFQSNSLKSGGAGGAATDQTLGLDLDRSAKGLGLKASFLQIAATATDGTRQTKTTEHLELAMKDTQVAFNLQSNLQSNRSGSQGGSGDGDKTMTLDLARQTKGLLVKASVLQFASTAQNGQDRSSESLELNWQAHKGITMAGHWNSAGAQAAHLGQGQTGQGQTGQGQSGATRDEKRDMTATLDGLRLRGLRNSQAVLSLAQAVSQGKMQTDTRALRFDTDMPDTHVHLEYTGSDLGWDKNRNSLVSRAVRVASIAPGDWLHYSAYYKTRSQTMGGRLPDVRDYAVGMTLKHVTLAYHYLNQQEQPDGCVKDTVQSHYEADGPLTRKLAWNVQYDHTDDRADRSGLETWLAGFKGDLTPHESIALMLGRPELRVDATTVPGQTFKMTFLCKMDDADSVALNTEVTNWERKTKVTPATVTGTFRLDVNKGF